MQFYLLTYVEESDPRHYFIYSTEQTSTLISLCPWFALLVIKCILWMTYLPREIFGFQERGRAQIYKLNVFFSPNLISETARERHGVILLKPLDLESQEGIIMITKVSTISSIDFSPILFHTVPAQSTLRWLAHLVSILFLMSYNLFLSVKKVWIIDCMTVHDSRLNM